MFAGLAATVMISQAVAATSAVEALALTKMLYPECALACLQQLVPTSGCSLTDTACLCTNEELNAVLSVCALQVCSIGDAFSELVIHHEMIEEMADKVFLLRPETKSGSAAICGAPVRGEGLKPPLVAAVGFGVALVAYVLQLCSALPGCGRGLSWYDWKIIACVLLTVPPTVFAFTLSANGLGKDIWTPPLANVENVLFYYFLGELFYFCAQAMNKVSILFFLTRIFPHHSLNRAIWVTIAVTLAYAVSFFFATMFQCWPINHAWLQREESHHGRCNNIHLRGWLSAIFNIVLDIVILALPPHQLSQLQMHLNKKLMFMIVFSVGIFVTIASIIRLYTLVKFASSTNVTYDYMDAAYWSTIELYAGIITASLPAVYKYLCSVAARKPGWSKVKSKLSGASSGSGTGVSTGEHVTASSAVAHQLGPGAARPSSCC